MTISSTSRPQLRSALPSLLIRANEVEPRGPYTSLRREYFSPDPETVEHVERLLVRQTLGVVAHFYMDPELQGVLAAISYPHVKVADSLAMAEEALRMAESGVRAIIVLGVDFMAETVRATLAASGFERIPVLRLRSEHIGCTLASAAESPGYTAYLKEASRAVHPLHVIYVNTSLRVKAEAQRMLPTIACTSSNVLRLVLQAFRQIPDLTLWFGPDSYMGQNLRTMLAHLATRAAKELEGVLPGLSPETVSEALARFNFYQGGVCGVHHGFSARVVEAIRCGYPDAFITAHFEVPGEMFALGYEAQKVGRGVVGSTSNILDFIKSQVMSAPRQREQFVLGTESGMITAIVREVQNCLRASANASREVEIIFPVAPDAFHVDSESALQVIPGTGPGEGCSSSGGCATCPYMKMNSLDALLSLLERVESNVQELHENAALRMYQPSVPTHSRSSREDVELGIQAVRFMREYQRTGELCSELVDAVRSPRPGIG